MSRVTRTAVVVVLLTFAAAPAYAEELRLAVNGGLFNVKQTDDAPLELGVELQLRPLDYRFIPDLAHVRWVLGAAATADDAFWGYAGLRSDFELPARWWLGVGLAVSAFEKGDGLDLGATLEFRSSIEIAREIGERSRLGLILHHLSNASLYESNPGSESLLLSWSFGLGRGP